LGNDKKGHNKMGRAKVTLICRAVGKSSLFKGTSFSYKLGLRLFKSNIILKLLIVTSSYSLLKKGTHVTSLHITFA